MEKEKIKTLANCDEIEFLRQTNRIRKAVKNWLTITEVEKIRSRLPEYKIIPKNATEEEKKQIFEENEQLKRTQAMKNLDLMLDAMLEDHPEETVQVMKLCCFVDPDDKTSHHITFYMAAFTEMIQDEAVLDFFQSLIHLARTFGLTL